LETCDARAWSVEARQRKYRKMGVWIETALEAESSPEADADSAGA
jgi:hypothetical protein